MEVRGNVGVIMSDGDNKGKVEERGEMQKISKNLWKIWKINVGGGILRGSGGSTVVRKSLYTYTCNPRCIKYITCRRYMWEFWFIDTCCVVCHNYINKFITNSKKKEKHKYKRET